jgi:hypothetical protein
LAVSYATLTALPQGLSLPDAWRFHGEERAAGGDWLAATTAQRRLELDAGTTSPATGRAAPSTWLTMDAAKANAASRH